MTSTAGAEMGDNEQHNGKDNGFVDKAYPSEGKEPPLRERQAAVEVTRFGYLERPQHKKKSQFPNPLTSTTECPCMDVTSATDGLTQC
jgi:hypothetical protein